MTIALPDMPRFARLILVLSWLALFTWPVTALASLEQMVQEAIANLEQQRYAQALVTLQEVAARHPDPGQVSGLIAVAWLGRGFQLLAAGDFPAAREAFIEGRRYRGEDVRLWQGEGLAWYRQGRYAEAATVFEQAIGYAPDNAALHLLAGQAYYADGRMAEALDALVRAEELGGGEEVGELLARVRREWRVEEGMAREARGHFVLSIEEGRPSALAGQILDTLEEAYAELGADLAYYPEVKVPVLLYERAAFATMTGSPDWAGALYDGKIRVPLVPGMRMNAAFEALLYHEYAHVAVHFLANRKAPVWLNEGLAELAGRRRHDSPSLHLRLALKEDRLIPWDVLSRSFAELPGAKVPLAYEQSHALVAHLVDRYGWHTMRELLLRLAAGEEWLTAVSTAWQDYGMNWPAILEEWRASVKP